MKDRRHWLNLFVLLLAGMFVGEFIGKYMGTQFSFLTYGMTFGTPQPVTLDIGIIKLVLGITLNINVAGIIGMALGAFAFRYMIR